MTNLIELTELITQWGADRSIIQNSSPFAQSRKMHEEFCELVAANAQLYCNSSDLSDVKDAIGDVYVTLVMVCACNGTPIRIDLDLGKAEEMPKGPLKYLESLVPLLIHASSGESYMLVRLTARHMVQGLLAYCEEHGLDFVECVQMAYTEISPRKGTLRPDGVFVKEGS